MVTTRSASRSDAASKAIKSRPTIPRTVKRRAPKRSPSGKELLSSGSYSDAARNRTVSLLSRQRAWKRRVLAKDAIWWLIYGLLACAWVSSTERKVEFSPSTPTSKEKLAVTSICFALSALTMGLEFFGMAPAIPSDPNWTIMGDGPGGHYCYLTIHIVTLQFVYWAACLLLKLASLMMQLCTRQRIM